MLILYGNKKSENVSKVEYVLKYLKLGYDYKELDFEKDLKKPEYLKIHPLGKVPAIDDEGFILFESNVICRYLCEKTKNELYPLDLKERSLVNQWMDFVSTQVSDSMFKIFFGKDEEVKGFGLQKLNEYLKVLENQLKKQKYLVSNNLTLADIILLASLRYLEFTKVDQDPFPSLKKWREDLKLKEEFKDEGE